MPAASDALVFFGASGDLAYVRRCWACGPGVGGFAGLDEHSVAVTPASVHITYDANARMWHAAETTSRIG